MKNIKHIVALAAVLFVAAHTWAQHTISGYFSDGYMYRHDINPAIGNNQNYVSLPFLGNINMGIRGSLNLEDYIYVKNGKTTTFLNPSVSANEFLGNIKDENKLHFDTKLQLMSTGFKGLGGYITCSSNLRTSVYAMVPKALFQFAKEGLKNKTYDISNFGIHTNSYIEYALGYSRNINEKLRVGAAVKYLMGIMNVDAEFNKAQLNLGNDYWTAVTNAQIQASVPGLKYDTELSENSGRQCVSGAEIEDFNFSSNGFAVDLGVEYKLNDSWKFGASLLDLGFITWGNNVLAATKDEKGNLGDKTFSTNDYKFSFEEDNENNFEDELERLTDGLVGLYELEDAGDQGKRKKSLGATMNLAAEYTMPFYNRLSVGLINTTRFLEDFTWTEFRLSANVAPLKWFSANVNVAAGTYGCAFGWMLNIHPTGFNLFVGMDQVLGKVTEEFVPLSSNASFNLGINVPF